KGFSAWCVSQQVSSLPAEAEAVAAYLKDRMNAGIKVSSIAVTLAAIDHWHREAGLLSPCDNDGVRAVLRGIRRTIGTAPKRKAPATAERMSAILAHIPSDIRGCRDRALLLLGMAGALRRSELVALDIEDLAFTDNGLDVIIRRSKTDQEGQGTTIAVPHGQNLMPVEAVRAWISAADL